MNNDLLETYSKEEIKTDIMRYKTNGASFWLCMLAIVFDVIMFITIYKTKSCTSDFELGFDLIVNVIFLLAVFLTAEKVKAYNKIAGYVAIGIGAVQIFRIFWIPLKYYKLWVVWDEKVKTLTQNYLSEGKTMEEINKLLPAVDGLSQTQFTWCVILIVASCLCLVAAGIIAILKQKKLAAHLEKINRKG